MKNNWQRKKLGQILRLEYGKPLPNEARDNEAQYPVYGANGIKSRSSQYYYDMPSIIVGRKGSAGEVNLTEEKFWPLDVTYFVTFDRNQHDLKYLYHILKSLELTKFAKGVKPGINRNDVYNIEVNVPTLPEQVRLVKILDAAFEHIAKLKEDAEKNINNVKDLFESYLNIIFSGSSSDWVETNLKKITEKIGSGSTPKGGKQSYHDSGISLIRSLNVYDDGFRERKLVYLDENQAALLKGVTVEEGDVLFNITGASITRCCVVPDSILPARVNQHVSIIRPITNIIKSEFLHYLLIAKVNKDKLLSIGLEGGSTRQALTKKQLEEFLISYPKSLNEQAEIIAKLDELSAKIKLLLSNYRKKLEYLDDLKQSILHQAFTGKL